MDWMNPPARWQGDRAALTVTTDAKTDFWRITHYDFIRDNGHVYYETVEGDFVASVRVIGAYRDLYDQAGLMIRADERHWIKCGIELVNGVQQASAVVTREFSDWSVVALPSNPPHIDLRVKREGDAVTVEYSTDGDVFTMLRLAYFPPGGAVMVGPMCCSPDGAGFGVRFEHFTITRS